MHFIQLLNFLNSVHFKKKYVYSSIKAGIEIVEWMAKNVLRTVKTMAMVIFIRKRVSPIMVVVLDEI